MPEVPVVGAWFGMRRGRQDVGSSEARASESGVQRRCRNAAGMVSVCIADWVLREKPLVSRREKGGRGAKRREIGILLPDNQRQHRTLHIQEDVLPYVDGALC